MMHLTPNECRVLGVLIEKAMTTPAQYPLSLNGITTGCNQKNNRDPIVNLSEDDAFDALDGLKQKGLARQVTLTGSRVDKYRHVAKEALDIGTNELVILAELLLRGPQTVGELRGRASRMHSLESTEVVDQALRYMRERDEPLVRTLPPLPGTRAQRYMQLLCPELHEIPEGPALPTVASQAAPHVGASAVGDRVERLEQDVRELRAALQRLADAIGAENPFESST